MSMLDRVQIDVWTHHAPEGTLYLDQAHLAAEPAPPGSPALADDDIWRWRSINAEVNLVTIDRGPRSEGIRLTPEVGTAMIRLLDPPLEVFPNTPIRITGDEVRLFTGVVSDITTGEERLIDPADPSKVRTVTTIIAVDLVQDIVNRSRYGAVVHSSTFGPLRENAYLAGESFAARMRRYIAGTGWDWAGVGDLLANDWGYEDDAQQTRLTDTQWLPASRLDYEQGAGTLPGGWLVETSPAAMLDIRPLLPAPPGVPLQVSMWIQNRHATPADIDTPGPSHTVIAPGEWAHIEIPPTAGDPWIVLTSPDPSGDFRITGIQITATPYCTRPNIVLGSVVYESSLANHLDITTQSTRGVWFVDATNQIHTRACRHNHAGTTVELSDVASPSYVDIQHEYATDQLVNDLQLHNHQRVLVTEDGNSRWEASQAVLGPWVEQTHAATYGRRLVQLETAIEANAVRMFMAQGVPSRIADDVAALYMPEPVAEYQRPRQVTIYHKDGVETPKPDIMDPLNVTRRGRTHPMLAAHITHTITPDQWHQDVTLLDQEST